MLKIEDIMTEEQKVILSVFEPGKIKKTEKEIEDFNEKTKQFLKDIEKIKFSL